MAEAKQTDKINEFMQGFLKYIVDKEKKDEEDFLELNEQVEREQKQEELKQEQLKQEEKKKKRDDFLEKNKVFKTQLDNINADIKRLTKRIKELEGKIKELEGKESTGKQTEMLSESIKNLKKTREKNQNTRKELLKRIDRKILEQELLPSEPHNPDCDANPEGKNCSIMG